MPLPHVDLCLAFGPRSIAAERPSPARPITAVHRACKPGTWTASQRPIAAIALLSGALTIRLALMPSWAGRDFRSNMALAQLALDHRDVYGLTHAFLHTHHLLAWTYFPLCLHLFAALTWLGVHTGVSIQLLGKLPNVAADFAVGWLIYVVLRRQGHSARVQVAGMALYLFNPLTLYNGAYYGRFDSIPLAFLLLALECRRSRWFALIYAVAIAAKTFPLFLLPALAVGRERQSVRRLALALGIVLVLALPYIMTDTRGLLSYLFVNNTGTIRYTGLGRLSWYLLLWSNHWLSMGQILTLARLATLLFPLVLLGVAHRPLYAKATTCFVLFLVLNRTVYEQYLLWPVPFLIVVAIHERSRLAAWLIALYTTAGILENESTWTRHGYLPWQMTPHPWLALNAVLALSGLVFVATQIWRRT